MREEIESVPAIPVRVATMPRKKTVMYCVEPHFVLAKSAMEWSLQNVVDEGDSLHVVTILPPVVYSAAPGESEL